MDFFKGILILAIVGHANAADNGLAITPPMGWRSWNQFQLAMHQDLLVQIANAMTDTSRGYSLAQLGFVHLGLDDGWQACNSGPGGQGYHDAQGNPNINTRLYPDFLNFTQYAHSLGLKPGWYHNNCYCKDKSNSYDHFVGDVKAIVGLEWDGVKLDGCGGEENVSLWYTLLNETGRPVLMENCHNGPPATADWCPFHFFRSSTDIRPTYATIIGNMQTTLPYLQGNVSRPGCWAYPDMLEVGVTNTQSALPPLTYIESRTHFAAWSIVSAPLYLSFDLTNATTLDSVWDIISNDEIIAVDQAWDGEAGRLVTQSNVTITLPNYSWWGANVTVPITQVWAKRLSPTTTAVFLVNSDDTANTVGVTWAQLNLPCSSCGARDLYRHVDLGTLDGGYSLSLDSHDSALIVVSSRCALCH